MPAAINQKTGVVQIDVEIDQDSLSFALDIGASYSFASDNLTDALMRKHPGWPRMTGTLGCANMWGWWPPNEQTLIVIRVAEIGTGELKLSGVGLVGVPRFANDGPTLGDWYSRKTARPVSGFLGPNAFRSARLEIDYPAGEVYLEPGTSDAETEMDLVGLTLRPEADGTYSVLGVAEKDGRKAVEGIEPGDLLVKIDSLETRGETMGTVVDALRGRAGETRVLTVERTGSLKSVSATVLSFL